MLSLDAIRLLAALGASARRATCAPPRCRRRTSTGDCSSASTRARCTPGRARTLDSAGRARARRSRASSASPSAPACRATRATAGAACSSAAAATPPRDGSASAELALRVRHLRRRAVPAPPARLGAARRAPRHPSAVMELGEAVQTAIEHGLPLLLSTEAAGELKDTRPRRAHEGPPRPADHHHRRRPQRHHAPRRRRAGDRRTARAQARRRARSRSTPARASSCAWSRARPLADDPVLLGRQREIAALKVVGSGVDASQTGTGKTITTGRALAHRAATTPRLRALVVAEGRLLGQWRDELPLGAPGRGLPPLAPNVDVLVLAEHGPIAGQLRALRPRARRARPASRSWPTACSTATPASSRRSTGTC